MMEQAPNSRLQPNTTSAISTINNGDEEDGTTAGVPVCVFVCVHTRAMIHDLTHSIHSLSVGGATANGSLVGPVRSMLSSLTTPTLTAYSTPLSKLPMTTLVWL